MPTSDDKKTYSTVLPPDLADGVEDYRKEREISKSRAIRDLTERGLRWEHAGVIDAAMFSASVVLVVIALSMAAISVVLTIAVALSGVTGVSALVVGGLLGSVTAGFFLAFIVSMIIQRVGLAAWVDKHLGGTPPTGT